MASARREGSEGGCACRGDKIQQPVDARLECRKCRENKANVKERGPGGYCTPCFLKAATKRFMSAMSRNALMDPGSSILVSLSGGWGSRMCLHLCLDYLVNSKHRAPGRIGVVFVKEYSDDQDDEIAEAIAADIASLDGVDDNGLQVISLDHVSCNGRQEHSTTEPTAASLLDTAHRKDPSAVDEVRRILRERAVVECARRGQYSRIIDGSCGTTLTSRSIAGLASGIGFAIPTMSTYYDARFSPTDHHIVIVRPLHDCTAKEVALFCYLSRLRGVKFRSPPSVSSRREHLTIDSVSRSFVQDINDSLPSSNHNILASFGKLTLFPFNHSRSAGRDGSNSRSEVSSREVDESALQSRRVDDNAFPLCEVCYLPRDERDLLQSSGQQQMRVCRRCADCISV